MYGADKEMEKLAEYLLSLTVLEYDCLRYFPSIISSSAVFLAGHILGKEPWPTSLQVQQFIKHILSECGDMQHCIEDVHLVSCQIQCEDCALD